MREVSNSNWADVNVVFRFAIVWLLCTGCRSPHVAPPVPSGPNGVCNTDLTGALRAGDSARVEALIARHASVRCTEPIAGDAERVRPWTTPLELAVASGRIRLVQLVIAAGAQPGSHDTEVPAIYRAVRMGRPDLVEYLLQSGASANSHSGNPILREAIKSGNSSIVRLLLQHGANPNKRWWSEFMPDPHFERSPPSTDCAITPLMEAAARGDTELVRLLLVAGGNRDEYDCRGQTARDYAVRSNHNAVADMFKE